MNYNNPNSYPSILSRLRLRLDEAAPGLVQIIIGPRQVGKTWLAREAGKNYEKTVYLNYDRLEDRRIIQEESWLPSTDLLILDEPTNHINFRHIPVIADAINNYNGAMILVSHSKDFLEKIKVDITVDLALLK